MPNGNFGMADKKLFSRLIESSASCVSLQFSSIKRKDLSEEFNISLAAWQLTFRNLEDCWKSSTLENSAKFISRKS